MPSRPRVYDESGVVVPTVHTLPFEHGVVCGRTFLLRRLKGEKETILRTPPSLLSTLRQTLRTLLDFFPVFHGSRVGPGVDVGTDRLPHCRGLRREVR